jgi:enoyl-CoA hydratase/carnithine racemase
MMLDLQHRQGAVVIHLRTAATTALNFELLDSLAAAIVYIGPDRPIVLTGEGNVFAYDLNLAPGPARPNALERLSGVLGAVHDHPLPVVAAINGDAVGTGYALAEAADLRIMSGGVVQPSSQQATRFHPKTAVAAGLVDLHCSPGHLVDLALRLATRSCSQTALVGGRQGSTAA